MSLFPWSHVLLQASASFLQVLERLKKVNTVWVVFEEKKFIPYVHTFHTFKIQYVPVLSYPEQDFFSNWAHHTRRIDVWTRWRPMFQESSPIVTFESHFYHTILQLDLVIIMLIHQHYSMHMHFLLPISIYMHVESLIWLCGYLWNLMTSLEYHLCYHYF